MSSIRILVCCTAFAFLSGCDSQPAKPPVAAPTAGTTTMPTAQNQPMEGMRAPRTGGATSTDPETATDETATTETAATETKEVPADESEDTPDAAPPAKPKTVGATAAAELAGEFDKDEMAADKKYQGKAIVVEGKVESYLAKDGYIYLTGSNDTKVICILAQKTEEPIKYGDTVAVKGKYDLRAVLGVSLKDCELLAVNP